MYKEERDVLEEVRKSDECDMEEFGRPQSTTKRSLSYEKDGGHRRRNTKVIREANSFSVTYGKSVMSVQMLEVFLLGVRTVLRLERDAWSMVK